MSCPSENTIVALASGALKGERRRSVEEHLDHCPECASQAGEAARHDDGGGEFSEIITSIEGVVEAIEVPMPATLPAGTVLGRYIVIDLLATGGLGQVYTAYDPDLDRKVAIKLLRPLANHAAPDAHAQRWLLREAQAMAKLSHPNVVPIHDVGTHAASVFIAMELVDGQTFSGWRRAGGHSWQQVRDLLLAAGEGLIAAHDAGLVHRDFKPANILVGHDGRVRVVDFGLARAVAGPAQNRDAVAPQQAAASPLLQEPLTEPGTVVGTPPFMPAEQFQDENVGPWSDQFAFCATMFLGLYGTRPFPDRDLTRLRTAILNGNVTPPSGDTKVPPWLHRAVLKGLEPNPQQRHRSMTTLLDALVQDRRSRKRQWVVLSLVAVLSASTAGVATAMLQPVPSEQDKETIEAIVAQARDAAQRAHFIYPPVSDAAAPTAYHAVLKLDAIAGPAAELATVAATDLRREFAASLVALGDAYWEKDGGSAFAADYYGAAVIFGAEDDRVLARALRTSAQLADLERRARNREFSTAELSTAALLAVLADPDAGNRRRRASALVERDDGPPATVRAQLQAMFGTANPDRVASRQSAPSERDPNPALGGEESPPLGSAAAPDVVPGEDGTTERPRSGQRETAKTKIAAPADKNNAVPTSADSGPTVAERDPDAAREEVKLGHAAGVQGRWEVAVTHYHRALDHDPRSAAAAGGLCDAHWELAQFTAAAKYGRRAVARAPKNAGYHKALGDAYLKLLRYKDARASYLRAKALGNAKAQERLDHLKKFTGG